MATSVPAITTGTVTGKRTRPLTPSRRSSSSGISSTSPSSSSISSPETKIARSSTSPTGAPGTGDSGDGQPRSILCTLPPTCNRHPITLANSKELERHYATYHAHVCEQPGCGCVFPETRLLELHQTECHDPLAAVRKERGEKIFGCMVSTCPKLFISPKARRLHMIEAHKYPKEFFFAVTNKGIGGLLRKWGEGASMIRGEWKPRDSQDQKKGKGKAGGGGDKMVVEEDDDEDEEKTSSGEEAPEVDMEELERTPRPNTRPLHPISPPRAGNTNANTKPSTNTDVDALAEGMSSLTLIPSSIRFGRGARGGGLGTKGRGRGGRGGIVPPQSSGTAGGGTGHSHQRRASMSSVTTTDTAQMGAGGTGTSGGRGRGGRKGKGHRVSASIGTGMEMDVSGGGEGGDVVLLPPTGHTRGGERGRGGRGKKGGRGGSI
ncbi:hypothetical protein P691DRAFT_808524 [Macrolepiota fuliginosa MF-IS2]|uniref:C2H2-type domain-containing protein n=1 Tax=Macrolepiota fuliginosa MF-IS2 TaxID=1400762 RepID=A0A9P6C9W1_9AGAR|nr:hypothetical protein P691DRAFT_808524 [Macrolepiota fuliginosa MF-IS2]